MQIRSLILGVLAGGFLTMILTVLWPKDKARLLRPIVAACVGAAVAYLVMMYT